MTQTAQRSILALSARDLRVQFGVNRGDAMGVLGDLVLDDVYALMAGAKTTRLGLLVTEDGAFRVSPDSALGTPGRTLFLDALITLMPDRGANIDVLIMVQVDPEGMIDDILLLPQSQLSHDTGYRLVRAEREGAARKLAQRACAAFARGTHITLGTGAQKRIEDLRPGDRVLTRDAGIQEVSWIGQTTTRAHGAMAPILIKAGALHNAADLLLSPEHRLMVYQRHDAIGAGGPEILVRAGDLVNGDTVTVQDGGFVEYFQLLFADHHIVYAEGIAAESLLLDPITHPALPPEIGPPVIGPPVIGPAGIGPAGIGPAGIGPAGLSGHLHAPRKAHGIDIDRDQLAFEDALALLRRASTC